MVYSLGIKSRGQHHNRFEKHKTKTNPKLIPLLSLLIVGGSTELLVSLQVERYECVELMSRVIHHVQ